MICAQCGHQNNPGDKFCEQCGNPLANLETNGAFGATVVASPAEPCVLVRLDGGRTFTLGSRAVVGRLDSCDVPVDDKSVSREHARLSRLRDGYVIEDLGSTNGTLVNGRRIDEAVILRAGDIVTIGSIDFRFDLETAASTVNFGRETAVSAPPQTEEPAPSSWPEPSPGWSQSAPDPWKSVTDIPEPPPPQAASPPGAFPTSNHSTQGESSPVIFPPLESSAAEDHDEEEADTMPPPIPKFSSFSPETADLPSSLSGEPAAPKPAAEPALARSESVLPADATSEMADQLTGLIQDLAKQLRSSRVENEEISQKLQALQKEHENVQGRLQTLQDADYTRGQRLQTLQREHQELQTHFGEVEEVSKQQQEIQDAIRHALADVPAPTIDEATRQRVEILLDSLIASPRDIDVLTQTAQQASNIASLVQRSSKLRRSLESIASRLGEHLAG